MSLVAMKAVSGYADGTFRPAQPMTRAQFAKVLVNVFDMSLNGAGGPHFRFENEPRRQGQASYAIMLWPWRIVTDLEYNALIARSSKDQAAYDYHTRYGGD